MSDEAINKAIDHILKNPLNNKNIALNVDYYIRKIKSGDYFHYCKECGEIEFANYTNKDDLKENKRCFSCQIWIERSVEIGERILIVERQGQRQYFSDAGAVPVPKRGQYGYGSAKSALGFGGARWLYRKLSNPDVIIETNNMWHGGDVPEHLYHLFDVNAVIEE